jgi:hypothetical protein
MRLKMKVFAPPFGPSLAVALRPGFDKLSPNGFK